METLNEIIIFIDRCKGRERRRTFLKGPVASSACMPRSYSSPGKRVDRSLLLPLDLTVGTSGCQFKTLLTLTTLPSLVKADINEFAIVDVCLNRVPEAGLGTKTLWERFRHTPNPGMLFPVRLGCLPTTTWLYTKQETR